MLLRLNHKEIRLIIAEKFEVNPQQVIVKSRKETEGYGTDEHYVYMPYAEVETNPGDVWTFREER